VLSLHGADIDRFGGAGRARQLVLRLVVRGADTVVACSRALARHTVEVFPEARDKTTYVHNGLELSQFEAIRPARPGGRFVLTVCRQVEKKGVDTLLQSFALARPRLPGVSLVIVGDGPLLAQNKALAHTLGIAEQVRFVGSVPRAEVLALFAACDLFVLASRREPFGLVLLEAAYYRKAILATRVGGIPEVLTHDVSAILVDPDDAVEMARHMSGLLGDTDRAQRLGAQAHRTLMDRFLWADRVRDYVAVYEGVSARSPVPREVDAPI
jgi:glycogen(starch) synthase